MKLEDTKKATKGKGETWALASAPTHQLPKGSGAIKGIGEKFAANPVTGTGSMSVPIATSPGRSGFGPQLSLSYDSGAGNGPFGFGWNLSLPSITRKTDKGLPQYLDLGSQGNTHCAHALLGHGHRLHEQGAAYIHLQTDEKRHTTKETP